MPEANNTFHRKGRQRIHGLARRNPSHSSGMTQQPNNALHPTCYSGLRPLSQAGELKRLGGTKTIGGFYDYL